MNVVLAHLQTNSITHIFLLQKTVYNTEKSQTGVYLSVIQQYLITS